MTIKDEINNEYFEWMYDLVCEDRFAKTVSYRKLLMFLHRMQFIYSIPKDENRAADGIDLRRRFALYNGYDDLSEYFSPVCSVLEMMIALAVHCEEGIMDDSRKGDRTGQWFWGMVVNLGLGSMDDSHFDKEEANDIVVRFLYREYEPDGRGGLFTINNCEQDLRTVEIWHQLCWYLDSISDFGWKGD